MMRFMFFIMGIPMMILSFFEAVDVIPYVSSSSIIVNGNEIVLSQEEQDNLEMQVCQMFEKGHTLPAFCVVFNEMFQEQIAQGKFVSLKFDRVLELGGLPFDELVFAVDGSAQGIDLMRGMKGVFQGRCVHVDLMGNNMQELADVVDELVSLHEETQEAVPEDNTSDVEDEIEYTDELDESENLTMEDGLTEEKNQEEQQKVEESNELI